MRAQSLAVHQSQDAGDGEEPLEGLGGIGGDLGFRRREGRSGEARIEARKRGIVGPGTLQPAM